MKNQLAFIPDNISAISGASVHIHPASRNEVHDLHGDSTDMFIDEILKQRTEKGPKEKDKIDKSSGIGSNIRFLQDFKESQESNLISEVRLKQSMKASRDKHSKFELYLHENESIAQKPQLSELNDSSRQSQVSKESEKKPQKSTIQHPIIEDKVQILHNQTNQDYIMEKELHEISDRQTQREHINEDSEHKFVLPKIDRISNHQSNNVSIEQSHFIDQKLFKQNNSFNHSDKHQAQDRSNNSKEISHKDISQHSEANQSKRIEDLKKSFSKLQKNQELSNSPPSIKSGSRIQANKFIKQFQSIGSKIQSEMSGAYTPAKLLNQNHGYYEFTGSKTNEEYDGGDEFRNIAIAITERLNFNGKDQYQMDGAKPGREAQEPSQHGKKPVASGVNASRSNDSVQYGMGQESSKQRFQEGKGEPFQDDIQTEYSEISRECRILQHRYESNLAYLYAQTQQLQSYYRFMVLEEEKIDLKKEIITKQIQNKREKIQLRTASYTKRYNFIHPIHKNNDQDIDYTPKRPVPTATITRYQDIKQSIQHQKRKHIELEAKLNLLSRYYDIMKSRTISDNLEFETVFKYDSQIGTYVPISGPQNKNNDTQCSIANYFQTPKKLLNKTKSQTRLGKSKSKTSTITGLQSPSKKAKQVERTPLSLYNLMRFKSEISKDMMLEYEVYNLGRMKRIKDETRLLKKQLEYVDDQIQHFERSFAEELKKIEELSKPKKVTYETYRIDQKDNPYTKSPFCRDYNGNNRGMNNINVYRADTIDLSRKQINKSLSKSRYTIQRQSIKDLSLSKKQIAANLSVSLNRIGSKPQLLTTQAQSNRIAAQNNDDYGLYTMGNGLKEIQQTSQKKQETIRQFRRTPKSKSSHSREKNLTRFKTEANIDANRSPETTLKLRLKLTSPNLSKSKVNIKSCKNISIQNELKDD